MNVTECRATVRAALVAAATAVACSAGVAGGSAGHAAHAARADAQAYRASCDQSHQGRATCQREAGAALQELRRNPRSLDNKESADYAANARARCNALEGDDRAACIARMDGAGSVSGSVAGGGVYRELVTRDPAVPISPSGDKPTAAGAPATR